MYSDFFRLSEPPFSLTPDPRYLYMSERHREGLAHLFYGVQQPGGFVQLTGEIGSGKTTLCRCLVSQLPRETDIALILNPRLTALELLATVCDELRIPYPAGTTSIKILIDALNQRLLESHAKERRTVLIIDEAQNLHGDVLEQIRLLTNLETSQEKLLQIILIGQPELLSVLKRKRLRQLAQRITARYHLLPLSRRETLAYIQHRLLVAGRSDPVFTAQAMHLVYRLSGGVPRLINIICDRALLGAYSLDMHIVNARVVRKASRETQGIMPRQRMIRLAVAAGAVLLIALIAGAAVMLKPSLLSTLRGSAPASASQRGGPTLPVDLKSIPPAHENGTIHAAAMQPAEAGNSKPPGYKIPGAIQTQSSLSPDAASPDASRSKGKLVEIIEGPSSGSDTASSFTNLYARWGIKQPSEAARMGCSALKTQGFECLSQAGSWLKIRRYDVPVILELIVSAGRRYRATLIGLGDETATIVLGDREYVFPLAEIDRVWDGSFTLLWKPPVASPQLSTGMRGKDVIWIRQALDTLDGRTPGTPVSDLYDEDLEQRIRKFQKSQSLIQDGLAGSETLVRLTAALDGPNTPSLSRRAP
jgi:general secretion pathway protein A